MNYIMNLFGPTPQTEPIRGKNMLRNSAGGYSFQVDDWTRLTRFLILGCEGATYYATERKMLVDNAAAVDRCIGQDGVRVVRMLTEISTAGRAPKNDPAILALAMCFARGDLATKIAAREALPQVCRTGTHLFTFAAFLDAMRSWGRGVRKAVASWYNSQSPRQLALQLVKYPQRNGWSHRDVLRLSHAQPASAEHGALFRFAVKTDLKALDDPARASDATAGPAADANASPTGNARAGLAADANATPTGNARAGLAADANATPTGNATAGPAAGEVATWDAALGTPAGAPARALLDVVRRLHSGVSVELAASLVREYRLPREVVPTPLLNERDIWDALLESMPMHAMVRNLATMTRVGLLSPLSDATKTVVARLGDGDAIRGSRLHPIALLMASKVYHAGRGVRGKHTWQPVPRVVNALDEAFHLAFKGVAPTGKRHVLALDVSGSMACGEVGGVIGLSPREAAAAMSMITLRTEPQSHTMAFSTSFVPLDLRPSMSLAELVAKTSNLPFGGTDCAQPMLWAMKNRVQADVFVVYTDSETWCGSIHPSEALRQYRQAAGIDARLIVVGMVANEFSIADPSDRGMLDIVGFDASAPELMASFIRGEV